MALFVNWFQVRFSNKGFGLPYVDSATWDESSALRKNDYSDDEIAAARLENGSVRNYFVTGKPKQEAESAEVSISGLQSVLAKIVEFNLAQHLQQSGAEVTRGRWGMDAVRVVQKFDDIGLVIKQGVNVKYFAVTEPQFTNGITLNWIVRPSFVRPLRELPKNFGYDGYPVILKWPSAEGKCPTGLAPFDGHYLGTILSRSSDEAFQVLVRNRTEQSVPGNALFLEPRTDVISALESVVAKVSGQQSIQRKILQLSHSLKEDGRRNPGILRDQLRSALKVIDPSNRGEVTVNLRPNCEGKLWINCYATGVRPVQ